MIIGKDKEGTLMLEARTLEEAIGQLKPGYFVSIDVEDSMVAQGVVMYGSQFRPHRFEEGKTYITGIRGSLAMYDPDAFLQTVERKGLELELVREDASTKIYKVGGK